MKGGCELVFQKFDNLLVYPHPDYSFTEIFAKKIQPELDLEKWNIIKLLYSSVVEIARAPRHRCREISNSGGSNLPINWWKNLAREFSPPSSGLQNGPLYLTFTRDTDQQIIIAPSENVKINWSWEFIIVALCRLFVSKLEYRKTKETIIANTEKLGTTFFKILL